MAVIIHDREFQLAVLKVKDALGGRQQRIIFDRIGRMLRDATKEQMRSYPYAPLSKWTKMRTGRSRPLQPLVKEIGYEASVKSVAIIHRNPSTRWSIQQHHLGYSIPPRIGRPVMRVPLHKGGAIFFTSARGAKVPARPVWLSESRTRQLTLGMLNSWLQDITRGFR